MKRILMLIVCVLALNFTISGASASEVTVRDDLGKYFTGFTGTFVMYDPAADHYVIYNEAQSQKRLSPCSTFKIYNSLIGLETGVLDQEDVFTLIKWNGKKYDFPYWNHDHTLASATKESVVWYFQELASRIGQERMQKYLNKIDYGNKDISGGLTTFWLRSSLKISALEQVNLLNKLYANQLPFSATTQAIVEKNITLSDNNGIKLMGKTGSGLENGKWTLGWFVGCIENQGHRYIVATNIEPLDGGKKETKQQLKKDYETTVSSLDGANGGKAREITKQIAKELNLL
ncbi:penicillin-binding transpeptidase domain-containing protein [Sporomusa acidovorans]|uniref:beta-lactamase n=1 Tax=Sporomusa acidovorans (strain ATCC 49682 / DSM 3132 / Mol) TaxID=1123286 RepID=A0ABZ3J9C0_SPOA4|nr:penicillin-binding transpeptidase domain-containing protein [Sporomusa acidovorans]OZC15162.1 methicillin resistance mecR1 protein [Sporomusa acidovorans DSM 3132]SDF43554.1 bla regulator protein blaR1 [Sporomusa acidovorans]